MTALTDGDDMVDAGRERVRKFERKIHRLTADAADLLRGVYLLLVRFKLRPLSAVVVGSEVGSCPGLVGHGGSAPFGYEKSTLNVSECGYWCISCFIG